MNTEKNMTCQVCGRKIKASTGLIAHHGYKRPYEGWQTASCEGARYVPYEVSCDRLREVAAMVGAFIDSQEKELADFLANPPQTITVLERRFVTRKETEKVTYTRPEDFSPDSYRSSMMRTYENAFMRKAGDYRQTLRLAKADFASMQRRLDEWKPAAS